MEALLTSKRVLHETHNRAQAILLGRHDLVDKLATTVRVRRHESLLAHIRRELVLRHLIHLPHELRNDRRTVLRLAMLQDELDDVVLWSKSEHGVGHV